MPVSTAISARIATCCRIRISSKSRPPASLDMSLLLDARKKLQQAHSAQGEGHAFQTTELSLEEYPDQQAKEPSGARPIENARSAGQNLFAAKPPSPAARRTLPNRNLLFALGGTVLLLALGAGYFMYLDSSSNTAP